MKITIAGIEFDHHDYDERGDVLFLHVGKPKEPSVKTFETPEGHTVEYDEHGAVAAAGERAKSLASSKPAMIFATRSCRGLSTSHAAVTVQPVRPRFSHGGR